MEELMNLCKTDPSRGSGDATDKPGYLAKVAELIAKLAPDGSLDKDNVTRVALKVVLSHNNHFLFKWLVEHYKVPQLVVGDVIALVLKEGGSIDPQCLTFICRNYLEIVMHIDIPWTPELIDLKIADIAREHICKEDGVATCSILLFLGLIPACPKCDDFYCKSNAQVVNAMIMVMNAIINFQDDRPYWPCDSTINGVDSWGLLKLLLNSHGMSQTWLLDCLWETEIRLVGNCYECMDGGAYGEYIECCCCFESLLLENKPQALYMKKFILMTVLRNCTRSTLYDFLSNIQGITNNKRFVGNQDPALMAGRHLHHHDHLAQILRNQVNARDVEAFRIALKSHKKQAAIEIETGVFTLSKGCLEYVNSYLKYTMDWVALDRLLTAEFDGPRIFY